MIQRIQSLNLFSNFRGDLFGGLTAAVISLPLAIAFGIAAFAPLGDEYIAQGALAGLYASIIAGFLASLFGGTPSQITGPTAPMSVVITATIANFMKDPELANIGVDLAEVVLLLVAATIVLGGLLQIVLGLVGGGKLIKYIPYPVIAGFMNGIAVLIFLGQLRPFLGVEKSSSFSMIFTGQADIMPETIIVGIVTVITILVADRFIKKVPATLIGLIVGIGVYFLIGNMMNPDLLQLESNSSIVGPIPSAIPTPHQAVALFSTGGKIPLTQWTLILIPALILSVLASIDTLLTSVVADVTTKTKHNSNKELIGQGIGNIGAALFGALSAAGATVRTLVNINSGGRSKLSGMFTSLLVLLVILVLSPFVQWIPMAVLAGILMVTAIKMVDYSSLRLFKRRSTLENLFIVLAVTIITVTVDLMIAVGIGLLIACLLFVKEQIGRNIIRRKYSGQQVHSKKVRTREAMNILDEHGELIKVYELSDSLFFGTCDKLLGEIECDLESHCIILDLKRVHTIDLTGAQMIRQIVDRITDKGNHLLLSYFDIQGNPDKERLRNFMNDVNVLHVIGEDHIFLDTDHALEWAEDHLIDHFNEEVKRGDRIHIKNISVFKGLSPGQMDLVQQYVQRISFNQGQVIFNEGDPGDGLYFILSGYVSVYTGDKTHRFATFTAGVFFGEMAIFENKPRSATVHSETDTELMFLAKVDFMKLAEVDPAITTHILLEISAELSNRLRVANGEVLALEE